MLLSKTTTNAVFLKQTKIVQRKRTFLKRSRATGQTAKIL